MKNPLVSIIVPNYNHADYLSQRLESIFNQTYQNFEVILLDDVSTDNSLEIFGKYATHIKVSQFIINKDNSGSTFKQWDKGINLAKGDFIWIAETDDYCENNFLEKLIEVYTNQPEVALVFCQSHRVNNKGEVTGNWLTHTAKFKSNPFGKDFVMEGNLFIENYLIHINVIPNVSAVLFKKEEIKKIQPLVFKPFMKYNADWFYYIQLISNSKIGFINESLNYFRYHNSSVIAKAGKETSWYKIFKMELLTRRGIMLFLEKSRIKNLRAVNEQYLKGNEKLLFLTSLGYVNRGKKVKAILIVLGKPALLKKILQCIIQAHNDKK